MSPFLWVVPLVVFIAFASVLSLIDARTHLLPNRLVLASLIATLCAEAVIVAVSDQTALLTQSLIVAFQTLLVYIGLLVVSRGQLGMGDVKYSFVTGLIIGWVSPQMWLICIWLAFTLAALWALITIRQGGNGRQSAIAFGPFMSIAVVLCAVSSQMIL